MEGRELGKENRNDFTLLQNKWDLSISHHFLKALKILEAHIADKLT